MPRISLELELADLRSRLGLTEQQLPDDATDDQIAAAMAQAPTPAEPPTPEGEPEGEPEGAPEGEPEVRRIAAGHRDIPEGMVLIDESRWKEVQADVSRHTNLERRLNRQERDTLIAQAVTDGKFAPSRTDHYTALYESDPEGTKEIIAKLEPGIIPVESRGNGRGEDWVEETVYPSEWLPEVEASAGTPEQQRRVIQVGD
jgi:hypothetical protein